MNPDIMLWKLKADAERARAEAAEKERDDFRPAGEMLLALKARAEAAEERAHYAEGVADTNINRAEAAEKREEVLRQALELAKQQVDDLGYSANVGTDYITDAITAALEGMP